MRNGSLSPNIPTDKIPVTGLLPTPTSQLTLRSKAVPKSKPLFVWWMEGFSLLWHVDEEGKNLSVNTARYQEVIKMIKDQLPTRKLKKYWWQQDGATCHTSDKSLSGLKEIFGNRIISKRSEIEWPARSPDLNPLDYSFWGMAMKEVWDKNPKTIPELMEVVENFFSNLSEDLVRRTVANILKRAEKCRKNKGGHFENEL